jgi:glutamate/tyrosine decarboxylase-like PLP-dependent enzyme
MPSGESPLALSAEEMRALGYRTVDLLVERLTGDPGPVVRAGSPDELRARLKAPPPETSRGYDDILATLERDVLPNVARISHPGYLAYIPGEGTWPAALADLIASALNVDTCWWLGASGPTTVELVVLDWFREWVGYPEHASGVLVSGGSAANLTALACAREAYTGELIYLSDQTHSSVARAARALGFSPQQDRVVPTDERGRIHIGALRSALAADRAAGRRPLVLVANAGTTATGAVDPVRELADVCHEHGVWLHVGLRAARARLAAARAARRAHAPRRPVGRPARRRTGCARPARVVRAPGCARRAHRRALEPRGAPHARPR